MEEIKKVDKVDHTKETLMLLNKVLLSTNLVLVIALFIVKIVKKTKFKPIHFAFLLSSIVEVVAIFSSDDVDE